MLQVPCQQSGWSIIEPTTLRLAPDSEAEALADLKPYTYLQLTGYEGEWANWLPSGSIGPTDPLRRVAHETMNSESIGIPRFGPGGYYLTNVLFTQYFTGGGASIHYNYWSSNWGYSASHGCLGLPYADSAFLWNWATLGTPINVHR